MSATRLAAAEVGAARGELTGAAHAYMALASALGTPTAGQREAMDELAGHLRDARDRLGRAAALLAERPQPTADELADASEEAREAWRESR